VAEDGFLDRLLDCVVQEFVVDFVGKGNYSEWVDKDKSWLGMEANGAIVC
jgi:hypothetical protein